MNEESRYEKHSATDKTSEISSETAPFAKIFISLLRPTSHFEYLFGKFVRESEDHIIGEDCKQLCEVGWEKTTNQLIPRGVSTQHLEGVGYSTCKRQRKHV